MSCVEMAKVGGVEAPPPPRPSITLSPVTLSTPFKVKDMDPVSPSTLKASALAARVASSPGSNLTVTSQKVRGWSRKSLWEEGSLKGDMMEGLLPSAELQCPLILRV